MPLCQVTAGGGGCANAQDVMQQSPRDVVCSFARPIVPAPSVEFMEKEQGIRIVLVAIQGARPESHQIAPAVLPISLQQSQMPSAHEPFSVFHGRMCDSPPAPKWALVWRIVTIDSVHVRTEDGRGRNSRRSHVLSNICRDLSYGERVHPECSSRRCTLHQPIMCVPFDPQTAGGRQSGERWTRNPLK